MGKANLPKKWGTKIMMKFLLLGLLVTGTAASTAELDELLTGKPARRQLNAASVDSVEYYDYYGNWYDYYTSGPEYSTAAPSTTRLAVTITFAGTYDADTMGVDSQFADDVVTAMAASICAGGCTAMEQIEQEGRIEVISISAGSIVIVTEISTESGQSIDELDEIVTNTIVADVNSDSFVVVSGGVSFNATGIETEVVTDEEEEDDDSLPVEVALALAVILVLAIGIPLFCCCVAVLVFFKCIKGNNEQPQGQGQGATQFV